MSGGNASSSIHPGAIRREMLAVLDKVRLYGICNGFT